MSIFGCLSLEALYHVCHLCRVCSVAILQPERVVSLGHSIDSYGSKQILVRDDWNMLLRSMCGSA
jgi:hypothetical protein